jgi:hypothetical protein
MKSIFEKDDVFKHKYAVELHVPLLAGGVPAATDAATKHLERQITDNSTLLRRQIAELMVEKELSQDEAVAQARDLSSLVTFRKDGNGLYIGGYQLKAAIKEAASVALAAGNIPKKFGTTNKGVLGFIAEHVHVVEDKLHLGVDEPTGETQRFVHTFRGDSISVQAYVEDAHIEATVETDYEFKNSEWATIWSTGERQGIGATRSQGFGRYYVTRWDKI